MLMKLKYLILILTALFTFSKVDACNNSTLSIANQTVNADGSITYTLDVLVELGGFDAAHYGFALKFNSSIGTPTVVIGGAFPTTSTIGSGDLNSGSVSGTLQALTGGAINSVAADSDWNEYLGATNVISFESDELFGAATDDYSFQMQVTVMGCAESITFDANVNSGSAACEQDIATGQNCATCNITALSATTTACNPTNNTYTADVTVTYSNEPGSGTLDVNGQSFAITTSPQTVTLTGLPADGNAVNVTAVFSADGTCTLTTNSLFTAPSPCSCAITNLSATPTACNPADNSYSVDIIVTYSNDPGNGTLDVNGQSFAITTSPQTVTLTGLTSDGNSVNVTAEFSTDSGCTLTSNSLYTAPASCTVGCNANAGTISQ